jgi:transcription initiation factor TFIIB
MTETYHNHIGGKKLSATLTSDPSTDPTKEFVAYESFQEHIDGSEASSRIKRKYEKKDRSRKISQIHHEKLVCPDCDGEDILQDDVTGDMICTQCGMVLDAHLFFSDASAISFTNDEDKSASSGKAKTYSDPAAEKMFRKLQKAEKWTHTWADIHQIIAKKEINRYLYQLELPEYVLNNSYNLYKKIYRKNAIQGRGIKAMVAATVYTVCRQHQIPVFFKDIERVSKQEHSTIRKCFSYIMDTFPIQLPVLNAKQFIPQLVAKLGFSELLGKVASRILIKLESTDWGKQINNPKHMASISIFFAYNIMHRAEKLNVSITQKEFSQKVGMSETTLRKYKRIFQEAIHVRI